MFEILLIAGAILSLFVGYLLYYENCGLLKCVKLLTEQLLASTQRQVELTEQNISLLEELEKKQINDKYNKLLDKLCTKVKNEQE
jgi:hypothetical protein